MPTSPPADAGRLLTIVPAFHQAGQRRAERTLGGGKLALKAFNGFVARPAKVSRAGLACTAATDLSSAAIGLHFRKWAAATLPAPQEYRAPLPQRTGRRWCRNSLHSSHSAATNAGAHARKLLFHNGKSGSCWPWPGTCLSSGQRFFELSLVVAWTVFVQAASSASHFAQEEHMKLKSNLKLGVNLISTAAALGMSGAVIAAPVVSVDFESGGYSLAADNGGSSTLSTDQANSATHSAKLVLSDTVPDFAKVVISVAPATLTLSQAVGTFKTYISSGQATNYAPYMYYLVDSNKNGIADFDGSSSGDSFVIAFFTPTITLDTWMQSGLDQSDMVHVVGNRTGLAASEFSSSNGGGLLSNLDTKTLGAGLWGDLDILQIRVGAGNTGSNIGPYTAYVDDINVTMGSSAVPEPGTLALVGLALASLGYSRRKQA